MSGLHFLGALIESVWGKTQVSHHVKGDFNEARPPVLSQIGFDDPFFSFSCSSGLLLGHLPVINVMSDLIHSVRSNYQLCVINHTSKCAYT